MISSHVNKYFKLIPKLIDKIDLSQIEKAISHLKKVKKTKVEFFIGVGGSAGNCSHAVNDFRKICNIESYTPTDNVSELTHE